METRERHNCFLLGTLTPLLWGHNRKVQVLPKKSGALGLIPLSALFVPSDRKARMRQSVGLAATLSPSQQGGSHRPRSRLPRCKTGDLTKTGQCDTLTA